MTLIVITGPTGVGKTELCLSMAERLGTDIINADSRQIYREIPIGTAAPTEEQMKRVRHHFVATKSITDYYSAAMYEQEVMALLNEWKGDTALLCGGSMMYIDAVCKGIDDIPTIRDDIRERMKQRLETEGLEALTEELRRLDPQHWELVDKNNPRRIVHALEVCHQTGMPYSTFRTGEKKKRPFDIIKIGLTRSHIAKIKRGQPIYDHSELYERINQRVLTMVDDGLVKEAEKMMCHRKENALNTVGYKEMFSYFDGDITLEEAVRQIQSHTREYARKQLTWYKKDTEMTWFHPNDTEEIYEHIIHYEKTH
ncbi:MAG: tRNA (adenosine(37)-N6)-dimethylallyltransferase MiaA [Prevotella sp.]|nr:tRNA (adenosine(37)-N6)-dimethylallyltransferase MiaA [Prevotella sp.]MBQ8115151.1 tRNA (adenosine(37)-N6)-dimethylallyltransferase MiaA [Prevotella sp.]